MKNLLKDFTLQKVLRQLSEKTMDLLLSTKAGVSNADAAAIRKGEKNKTDVLKKFVEIFRENGECLRILRMAFFFHQNRSAFLSLRAYLAQKEVPIDEKCLSECKSLADQSVALCLSHRDAVAEHFIMCIHTHQSRQYLSRRNDYVNTEIKISLAELPIEKLKDQLLNELKELRGSKFCGIRSFEHQDKIFLIMEFDDLPSHAREFIEGKSTPEDQFRKLALDLTYVFDKNRNAVDVIADTGELRLIMHQACALAIYGQADIIAKPRKNEIFDLGKLFEYVTLGKPLAFDVQDSEVIGEHAFVEELRIARTEHPFWQIALNIKIPANHKDVQRDWVKEIQSIASIVNMKDEPGGRWHKSYTQVVSATLVVIYWDDFEKKEASKRITVNSSGGTNLGYSDEDERIKEFLRHVKLLKEAPILQVSMDEVDEEAA